MTLAPAVLAAMKQIPGVADAHIVQVLNYPGLQIDVDRLRAAEVGVAQRDVARQHADLAVVQRRRVAELLPQPAEQRELLGGGADAAADRSTR